VTGGARAGRAAGRQSGARNLNQSYQDVQDTAARAIQTPVDTDDPFRATGKGGGGEAPGRDGPGFAAGEGPQPKTERQGFFSRARRSASEYGQGEAGESWWNQRLALGGSTQRPTFASSGNTGLRFDKQTSARLIVVAMGVSGAAIIIKGGNATVVESGGVKVPGNLRAFTAVIVLGTVSLVLNEVSPSIGTLAAIAMLFVAATRVNAFDTLGKWFAPPKGAAATPQNLSTPNQVIQLPDGEIFNTGPTGSRIVPVPGQPGQSSIEPLPSQKNVA